MLRSTSLLSLVAGACATLGLAAPACLPSSAAASRPLALGFSDGVFEEGEPQAGQWLARAAASGASYVRLDVAWSQIAPTRPAHPDSPSDPAYHWAKLDEQVRDVIAHRLTPFLTVAGAPRWAEGAHRPASVMPGAWRPSAAALGAFAHALAKRYSGSYPDPLQAGATLPRVRYLQAWNEPNLAIYLAPQWVRERGRWQPTSPSIYRNMLNAFFAGVKSAVHSDVVISAGTAPFGDLSPAEEGVGSQRMPPVSFVRQLLCLRGNRLRPIRCPHPAHFEILDHHPYEIYGPFWHAIDAGDVSIPDMAKLTAPLRKAERTGRVLPPGRKAVWVTEIGWNTDPPNPHGVPMAKDARWVAQALYELWSENVSMVSWYLIRDEAPIPSYSLTTQTGMYFRNGSPKLAERAFRFPFLIAAAGRGGSVWWARTPVAGLLRVQRLASDRWQTAYRRRVRAGEVIEQALPHGSEGRAWRAVVGGQRSLVWSPRG